VWVLCSIVVAGSLASAAWSAWERHRQDPWLRLLTQAGVRVQKSGIALLPNSTPRQMAQQLQAANPQANLTAWQDWFVRLEALRYAPPTASQQTQLKHLLGAMRRELCQLSLPT